MLSVLSPTLPASNHLQKPIRWSLGTFKVPPLQVQAGALAQPLIPTLKHAQSWSSQHSLELLVLAGEAEGWGGPTSLSAPPLMPVQEGML